MPDKSNDTGSRIKHNTRADFVRNVPPERMHGTPEEIGNRVGGQFRTLPDNAPSDFEQLGPAASGAHLTDKVPVARSGNQKFGNPRKYA